MATLAEPILAPPNDRLRTFLPSMEERKGIWLSHLIGIALFCEFAVNVLNIQIPFTPSNSIPIRIIALWLLLDRSWRIGRLRLGFWDYLTFSFIFLVGVGMVYRTVASPWIPQSFDEYRSFVGRFLNAYIYYLVVKEALNRRGFRPDYMIRYLLAAFAVSASIGLMQAFNLFGARSWSMIYADPVLTEFRPGAPDFATGTASWWTTMALEMLFAFALVFGPTFIRKPKLYEWILGVLFMAAFIATQSRGGLIAFVACILGAFGWYVYHRKFAIAMTIITVMTVGILVWGAIVFALKIDKFTTTIQGERVKNSSAYSKSVDSRVEGQIALFRIGMKEPWFGIGPDPGLIGINTRETIWSPYAMQDSADGMYGVTFAEFGMVGIIYLLLLEGFLIGFIRKETAYRPYAFAAFFVGLAWAVHGSVENLLYQRTTIVFSVLVALASTPGLTEQGRPAFRRIVKMSRVLPGDRQ